MPSPHLLESHVATGDPSRRERGGVRPPLAPWQAGQTGPGRRSTSLSPSGPPTKPWTWTSTCDFFLSTRLHRPHLLISTQTERPPLRWERPHVNACGAKVVWRGRRSVIPPHPPLVLPCAPQHTGHPLRSTRVNSQSGVPSPGSPPEESRTGT